MDFQGIELGSVVCRYSETECFSTMVDAVLTKQMPFEPLQWYIRSPDHPARRHGNHDCGPD